MVSVWQQGEVVNDWQNAKMVPIPIRGNLQQCDNWRGIIFWDEAGKLFARILQDWVQVIAKVALPDSQCRFRRGLGCTDILSAARQVTEKTIKHDDTVILFVDLHNAYDSIPHTALWTVLQKVGVPLQMLRIIHSLHDGMVAAVRVPGSLSASFSVTNGLRQGSM